MFKALALGADGVLIARPFVTAVYGGGEEGVRLYIEKLAGELADAMQMCGARTLDLQVKPPNGKRPAGRKKGDLSCEKWFCSLP